MLDWYVGECKVSIININNGSKFQYCNISQILKFGGYVKGIFEDINYYLPLSIPY